MKYTKKLKIQLGKRSFRIPSLTVALKVVTKTIPQPLFRFGRPLFNSVSYVVRRNLPLFLATIFLTPAAILLGVFIISRSRTPSAQAAPFTNAVRVSRQSTTISTAGDWYKAMAYSGDGINGDAETGTFNPIHPGTTTDGSAGALAAGKVALTTTTYASAQFIGFKPNANGNLAGVTLVLENPTATSLSNPDIVVELLRFPSASCTTSCTNYVTGTQGAYDYPNDTVILRRTAWQFNQGLSGESVAPGNYGRATYDFRFDTPVAIVTTDHYGLRIINMGAVAPVFGTWAQAPISSLFPTIDGTIRTIGIGDIDTTNSTTIVMPEILTGNNYLTTSPMVAANSSAGIGLPTVRRTENEHWTATYSSATSNWTLVGSVSGTQTGKLTTTNNGGTGPSWVNDGVAMTTLTADITSTTPRLCVASITGFAANQTIDVWDSDTASAPFTILSTSASDGACPSSGPSITTTASLTAAANNVTMSKNATVARAIWKQRIVQGAIQAFTADMPTTTKICVADSSRFSAPTAGTGNNIVIWDNNTLLAAATLNRVVSTSQADGACASNNSITVATVVTGGTYTLAQNAYVAEYSANLANISAPSNGDVLRYTAFNHGQNPTGSTLLTRTNSVNLAYAKNEAVATSLVRYPFLSNRHIFFVAYGDADTSAPADGDVIIVGNGRPDPDTLDSSNLTNDLNWSTKQAHVVNIDRSWDAALAYTGVNASAVGDGAGSRADYAAWAVTGGWVSAVIAPGSQLGIANTANAHYRINIPGKIVIDSDASLALGKTGAAIPSSSGHDIYFDNTSPAASTTLTVDSAVSATLTVTSTTGFQVGDTIIIDDNNSIPITRIIAAVQSGTSITLTTTATAAFTVAQGAFIAKGPTTELPTGQDRRAGPYTYNTGRVSLYAAGSSAFRTSKSDLAADINGDINTGFLGNNLTDSGDTFLDVKDNVVGNWQPLDQISVAGGTNQLADNAFSSTGMGGTDDLNQMPLWAGQQAKVDANAGGRTALPAPNTEIAEIGTIPMTNIYNSDYNGGSALFSANYNTTSAWTIFGDNANTEVNDAVYFGDQGSNMPYALELNIGQAQNAAASHVWEYYDATNGWTAFTPRDAYTYQVRTGVSLPLSADTVLNSLTISLAEGGTIFAADQIVKIVDNDSPAIYRRIGALTTATVLTFTEPVPAGYTTAQSATVTRLNGGQWKSMDPTSIFASTGRRVLSWAPSNLSGTPAKTTINGVNAYWVRARISSFTSWTTSPTNQTTPVGMGGIERIPSGIFNVSNGVQEAKISEVTAGSSFDPNETYKVEYGNSPGWTQIVPYVPNAPYTWHIKDGTLSQNTITADTHIANGDLSWGDYTVTAKVKMRTVADATSRKIGVVLRGNLDGNGYGVLIEKTTTGPQQRIGIYPMASGVEGTVFVNFTKAFSDNTWYWIKANVTGTGASTVISAKFWADGGGEPGSWDTTFTTSAAQGLWNTGRVGLYADSMIADFDDVLVDNGSVVLSDDFTSTGTWLVNGSINGSLGTVTPGTPFTSNYINFTLKQKGGWDGVNTPEIGDKIYISSTGTRSYKGLSNTGASAITTSDTNTVYENVDFEWNPTASNYTVTGSATGAMGTATPGSAYAATGGKIGLTIPAGSPTATKFGNRMLLLQDNMRRNNGSWIGNNGYGSAALVYPYLTLTSSALATRYNIEGQAGTATARQRGTIDFWFKTNYSGSPTVLTHPKGMYLFDYANQGVTDRLFIRHTNDGYLEASVVGGTTQGTILRKSFSATAGQWYHFRLGWDETAANKRAWLDGVAFTAGEGQASALAARGANLGILRIGNAWTYDAPFDGSIDEFAIFDDDFDTSGGCNFGDFTPPTAAWTGGETTGCTTGKEAGVNIFRASFDTAMNPQEGSVLADYAWGIPSILFTNGADTGNERIRVVTYPQRTRIWVDNSGEKYTPSARIKFGSGFQENAAVATLAGWSNNFTFPHKAARQSTSSPTYSPVLNLKRSTHIWSDESITLAGATMGAPINAGMGFAMGTTGLSGLSTIDFSDVSMDNQYTNFAILTNPYTGLLVKPTQRISNSVFLNFYDRAYTVTGKTQGSNYVGAYFVTTHNAAANIGSGYNASTSQNVGIDGSIFMGNRNAYVTVPPVAANGAASFFSGRLYSVLNSEFHNNGVTGAGTSGALNFSSGVAKVTITDNIFSLNTNGIRLYGNSFFTMADNIFEGHVSDNVAPLGAEYGSGIRVAQTSSSVAIVDTDSIFGRGLWNEADIGLPPNLTTFEAESLVQFTGEGTQMLSPLLFGTADYSNMPRVADHYLASTIPGADIRMTGSSNEKDIVNATTFGFMRTTGSSLTDTTVHTNDGYAWRMEPINVDIPLEYTAKLVGVANKPLAATGYMRINSNYGSTNMPVVTLSGLGMSGANLTWTAAATPNVWQQFVVSGTPTESALAELKISTKLDYVVSDSGTSEVISQATGNYLPTLLEDVDKSWTPNQWVGYKLRDVNGKVFDIVKNTNQILFLKGIVVPHLLNTTFTALTSGDYVIYNEPYVYLDDISVLSATVDTGTLDFFSGGQPVSPWLSTGLTAEGVWSAQYSTFADSQGSFGQLVGDALVAQYADVFGGTPTTTAFNTNLSSTTDDFYLNGAIIFTEGQNQGAVRRISDYGGASKTVTVDPALPFAPADGDRFAILAATASSGGGGGATAADIWSYTLRQLTTEDLSGGGSLATAADISALNNLSAADIWTYATRSLTGEVTLTSDSRKAIWDTACAILNTSGTVGKLVCDNLDAAISTRSTLTAAQVWSEASRTITGLDNPALAAIANNVWANATRSLTDYGNDITAQQVWDVLTSSLTTIDSIGKLLVTNVDETISSRASQTSLDALAGNIATLLTEIGTGNISAIKTKTDSITWADVTGLVTTSGDIKAKTDTITWADVTGIKTKTDTITWTDITGIKLKTDTITWGDITGLTANIATLLTEIGTGNISAIKTKTDSITWADVTGLVTTSGDIKAKTDTITWADVTGIKTKTDTITWTDITGIKLKTDTITWGDITTLTTRVDTTVSSRASQTSLDAHESAQAAFRSSTTSSLGTLTVNVSAIMTQLSTIETKIDSISSNLSAIEDKIDIVDSNLDSIKITVEDTNTKVTAIQTVTNNILAKWGSYDAATIAGYVDTLKTNLGNPTDPTTATTVFGKLNYIKDSSGSGGTIDLIYAEAQSTHTKLLEVQTELGFNGKSTTAYDEMVAVKNYVDSVESSLATLDTRTASIATSVTNVSNDLKTVTDRIGKVSVDSFTQLFEVKSSDVGYLKNKVIELKAMADINRQLLEKVANQPIVKVVMEWGSVIIKFVIVNPSDSTTQKVPFKAFLPKEVKQEYIIDLGGLTLNYDTTTEQYYVTADITLEKGSAVTRSVRIKDIWIISEDEVASLRKQADELSSGLKNTSYFAQGLTLKTDINTRLDKVVRKQKDNNATPQDHILAYRENVEDMKAVNENVKGLKDLVLNSGVGGNFLASIGGIQTFATWGIILALIFGMGALGSFYYMLWKRKVVSVAVGKGKKMKEVELPTPTPFALPGFRFTWLKGILLGWKALLTDIFSALFHVGGTMVVHSNTVVAMARSMPKKTLAILFIAGLLTTTTVGGVIVARNASSRDQKQVAGAFTKGSTPTPTVSSTKAEKVDILVNEMIKKAEERKKINAKIAELLQKTENEATASALPVVTKPSSLSSAQKPTPTSTQNKTQGVVQVIKNPPDIVVIRDRPDTKASVIAKADAGKDYSFITKVGEWYQIVLPEGKIGWINNESVNKLGTKEIAALADKARVLGAISERQQLLVIKQTPTDWLNVRKNPSAVAQIITKVYPGERYPFSELQSGWYKIVLKDMTEGWVSSEYVKPENEMIEQSNVFVEVTPPQGGVNIREKPDLESVIIKRIYIQNRYPKLGETNGWVKIEMLDNKIGYVSKEFAKDIK